ncbi:MAG: DUF4433 domain-containing protein [Myxococcales bacterium]|nr:DUF4433 domain-containing protein [Myxococcales bacterium]
MTMPDHPKIYHIVHMDRLPSIVHSGGLWCDEEMMKHPPQGTTIGMTSIKQRRLTAKLRSYPGLCVGGCVPFYFCPRSVMLYLIHCANNPELTYRGGQAPILHLEADLFTVIQWAEQHQKRWAFTLSNAGSSYFEDFSDRCSLGRIDWDAVAARDWQKCKEPKQAEFLLEHYFPWFLVERIGVHPAVDYWKIVQTLVGSELRPLVEVRADWYYDHGGNR